ncbi:anti-sigma factor family protein [Marinobacter caseinilyticus]|uniref:anti-sigma factor family protein n=1 Tax=Marinobacter caseinilyticus TaxID=2692195 RepID=UPI001408E5C8|nr:DUF3379 domain-containing protein [Marinobacter caseinilyticus]
MNCHQFREDIEILNQDDASSGLENKLKAHAAECRECALLWQEQRQLRDLFGAQAIPEPSPDFEFRVLQAATMSQGAVGRRAWAFPAMGAAVAAILALGVYIGLHLGPNSNLETVPEIAATSAQPGTDDAHVESGLQTVKLAFNSRQAMDGVTLTLELPANVELAPFPGRRNVSWKVNLKQGDNVLALPLNVLFPGSGTLVAHLDDGSKRKTFRTAISRNKEPSS